MLIDKKNIITRLQNFNINQHHLKNDNRQPAAVLVPITNEHIILTKRHDNLTHHRGQICFPGGRCEANEFDQLHVTALRETEEEIGIPRNQIEILGELTSYPTLTSHFWVTPFVAMIQGSPAYEINQAEVEEVITLPIENLLSSQSESPTIMLNKIIERRHFTLTHNNHIIWGVTAMILYELALVIKTAL